MSARERQRHRTMWWYSDAHRQMYMVRLILSLRPWPIEYEVKTP